jgi:hypothetical protein
MKRLAFIAFLVLPVLMLASRGAYAGEYSHRYDRGCCGESRGEDRDYRPFWGQYEVKRSTFVSDRPRHGYGTDIRLKEGAWVRAKCYGWWRNSWCAVRTESIVHAFVPRYCLRGPLYRDGDRDDDRSYRRHYHRHHRYYHHRRYRESRYDRRDYEGSHYYSEYEGRRSEYDGRRDEYNGRRDEYEGRRD